MRNGEEVGGETKSGLFAFPGPATTIEEAAKQVHIYAACDDGVFHFLDGEWKQLPEEHVVEREPDDGACCV